MVYHYLWLEVDIVIHLLVNWLLSALALWIVARVVSGIEVRDFGVALIATAMLAIVNFAIGWFLRLIAFPLTILTFGLFLLVINAVLLKVASAITPGFRVHGFLPALLGALLLSILSTILRYVVFY